LFTHIRNMVWTTGPSITIALIVFLIVGFTVDPSQASVPVDEMQNVILEKFNIGWHLFLVPTIVIVFIAKKMPAIPALFIGSILGCMFALIFQPQIIVELAGEGVSFGRAAYTVLINAMTISTEVVTSNNIVTDLLSTGGMNGMMNTIWLIICALTFGGIMQATGMLQRITGAILSMVKSVASLVTSTAVTCVLFNILAADQYLAIVVPGKMYADAYRDRDLAPENLSRVLEDAGTVTSVLIPWNTCGVAQATVLGVATGVFWPYCIFNLVSPLMTILFGVMGWKMTKLPEQIGSDGAIED
jgi:Na+:H+ antiporter, NhaC family